VTYWLHLVGDRFFFAKKLHHPDLSGSTRFYIFLGGGSRVTATAMIGAEADKEDDPVGNYSYGTDLLPTG
jgi:hypothetical protein